MTREPDPTFHVEQSDTPPETPNPWERSPNETTEAFEAFITGRDMGFQRSNAKVARALGKSTQVCDRWSRMHGWVARFEEWDAELDRERRASQIEAVRSMAARHVEVANQLMQAAVDALEKADRSKFTPAQIVRFAEAAVRIERQALGEPTGPDWNVEVDEQALITAMHTWFAESTDEAFMAGAATAAGVIDVKEIEPAAD